jgi:hypothetical protein
LREQTAKQRSGDRSDIDCSAEDDEPAGTPRLVLAGIKGANLRRNIALEETRADDEQQQGQEE